MRTAFAAVLTLLSLLLGGWAWNWSNFDPTLHHRKPDKTYKEMIIDHKAFQYTDEN